MSNIKALIADDSVTMRKILSNILSSANFDVVGVAENGVEAVKLAEELSPDFVFLDVVMPEMDGIEALKQIIKTNPSTNVIMASSVGTEETLKQALELGAKNFIQKPYDADSVITTINNLIQQ